MHRRRLLEGCGAAVTGVGSSLAGCAATRTPPAAETPSTDAEPTPGTVAWDRPPTPDAPGEAFELVGIEAPSTVEINAPWRFALTVRNVADRDLAFVTRLSFRTPEADWRSQAWVTSEWTIGFPVPPGATRTWRSPRTAFNNLARYEFRLEAVDAAWAVETVPASRRFGQPYATVDQTVLTVHGLALGPDPAAVDDGGLPAGGPNRLARAAVSVRNRNRNPMVHDEPSDLVLTVDGRVLEPVARPGDARAVYAQPGEVTEGWVAFAVPTGLSLEAAVVSWRPRHFDGPIRVDWTAGRG